MVSNLRFIFLGTGTSAGVPSIACDCAVCLSTDPRDNRLRTSAAILWTDPSGHDRVALIDAGPDLRQQALRAKLHRCDAIFFTHNHVDHTFGLDEVRRFNAVQKSPIEVLAEEHTMQHLCRVYQHIFDRDANINDSFVASLSPRRIIPGEPVSMHGLRFTPIRFIHGRLPIVGFRIEHESRATDSFLPMAYCTDVSVIPPESWKLLANVKTLALDCLRERYHPTHLTLEQSVAIAQQVDADQTYFIHMAHDLPHQATCDSLPDRMALAYDGLQLGP